MEISNESWEADVLSLERMLAPGEQRVTKGALAMMARMDVMSTLAANGHLKVDEHLRAYMSAFSHCRYMRIMYYLKQLAVDEKVVETALFFTLINEGAAAEYGRGRVLVDDLVRTVDKAYALWMERYANEYVMSIP